MGIAKSAPSGEVVNEVPVQDTEPILLFEKIPDEIARYFDIAQYDLDSNDRQTVLDIYNILSKEGRDIGDILLEIQRIERHLGHGGSTRRHNKVWNYLKLNDQIESLEKQRESLRR